MSSDIGPGDLVLVVKSCCAMRVRPRSFRVHEVEPPSEYELGMRALGAYAHCVSCDAVMPVEPYAGPLRSEGYAQPLSWLRKLTPPGAVTEVLEVERLNSPEPVEA